MPNFSLEQLSKIRNATENTDILDFFWVLDNAVGETSGKVVHTHVLHVQDLREDTVVQFPHKDIIVGNFPHAAGDYLQVPKVI